MPNHPSDTGDLPSPPDDNFDADLDPPPPRRKKEIGIVPATAIILAFVGVICALLFALKEPRQPAQDQFVYQPTSPPNVQIPIFGPQGRAMPALEPGMQCAIANLRLNHLLGGFGGQPGLMFDYQFPRNRPVGGNWTIAVVTAPGQPPATATLSLFSDESGTVSILPFVGVGPFRRGTTVYLADQLNSEPNGTPKRISNILTLE